MTPKISKRPHLYRFILFLIPLLIVAIYGTTLLVTQNPLTAYRVSTPLCKTRSLDELKKDGCCFHQSLMLINDEHPLEDDFLPSLAEYKDSGVWMNEAIHDAYRMLAEAVRSETEATLYVSSAARDQSKQIELYNDDPSVAQKPRCSEHEAGLALDVYVEGFAGMGFIKSKAGQFVNAHCQEYGFIIRYPLFKKHKTGIAYEPWHIRYVGKPHSAIISRFNITLEEYIKFLSPDVFYIIDGYCISRQSPKESKLKLPANCNDICVSPDNTGNYIVTGKVGVP